MLVWTKAGRKSHKKEIFDRGCLRTSCDAQFFDSVLDCLKGSSDGEKDLLKREDMMQSDTSRTAEIKTQITKIAPIIQIAIMQTSVRIDLIIYRY